MAIIKTELIDNYLRGNKVSKTEFCKRCKIAPITLKKIYNNDNKLGITVLFKIAKVLGINACELINMNFAIRIYANNQILMNLYQ